MITRKGRFYLLAAAFVALAPLAWGQRYSDWRVYRASDGLPESGCVSVSLGANGRVFVKHADLDSISELDGYSITSFPSPEIGRNRIYESSPGQLWSVTSQGLEEFRNHAWRLHPIPQFSAEFRGMATAAIPPIPMRVIKPGRVLVLLPDQLIEFSVVNPGEPRSTVLRTASQTTLEKFLGMMVVGDGSLWISGQRGLARAPGSDLAADTPWQEFPAPRNLQAENFQQPIADVKGTGLTCIADSASSEQKLIIHFDGRNWTAQPVGPDKLRGAWQGPEGVTWVDTINALLQIDNSATPAAEIEEVTAGRYFDVTVETNGIFWLASAEGLLRYSPPLWKSPPAIQRLNTAVPCMTEDSQSRLWFVSAGALHSLDGDQYQEHVFPTEYRRYLQAARALLPLKNGDLLLDTGEQLFQYQPGNDSLNLLSSSRHERQRTLGVFRDGSVAVQSTDPVAQTCHLERYDGVAFHPLNIPLPDCAFSAFLERQNGDLWLGGDRGVVWRHDNAWQTYSNKDAPHAVVSFIEIPEGKVWCATLDSIWEFNDPTWSPIHTGFDQIGSVARTRDGNVWVASNGGLHRFVQGAWVENSLEEGLPSTIVRQVYQDPHGRLWVGTARGLSLFRPELDSDPPRTRIRKQPDKDSIPQDATVTLVFNGEDRWKYTPAERLLYSYRLDQRDWTQFLEKNAVSYPDLAPGTHSFEVRAMDRNGNVETRPAHLVFTIAIPWYEETRLLIITFCGMAAVVFFAGLAFNRHRKLLLSYAQVERKVAERTRELEIASRELVHSQKMNALGTLAAGIAHDFNNILSIIKGSAQIIEDNVDNSEKIRVRVDRIKTVVEQGAGIVKAMLGFSAGSSEEPAACDINAVVSETIQLLGDRFQRDTAVLFQPKQDLPPTPAVKEFIQQILLNFIFNAAEAEASARRRQIIVGTRRGQQLPENLALAPASAAEYVMISVQDFGCGIPPENLARIFEPFFTTKALSARRGTGLGLSMVYELAKKMEAGLGVESTVNVGSAFTLILPLKNLSNTNPT